MMTAVIVAMIVMIIASKPLTTFVNAHPTVIMLCLAFLLMIGLSLIAEGFGAKIPKGYLYAAIVFSIMVETFNQIRLAREKRRVTAVPMRQRAVDGILRLLGGQPELGDVTTSSPPAQESGGPPGASRSNGAFAEAEREMIAGVLRLGTRITRYIMTPRQDIGWLDVNATNDEIRATLTAHGHARYLVCNGQLDDFEGVIVAYDSFPISSMARPSTCGRGCIRLWSCMISYRSCV